MELPATDLSFWLATVLLTLAMGTLSVFHRIMGARRLVRVTTR